MVDAHCHIDLYPNPPSIVHSCEQKGIYTLGMTNLPSHFKLGIDHVRHCKRVRLALGLHPLHAQKHRPEWPLFSKYLPLTSYVGEVGLDFSPEGISTQVQQVKSFRFVLNQVGNRKVVSLHSRGAEKQVLSMLVEHQVPYAIFHWFTGTPEEALRIADAGYYFSINPAMIRSAKGRAVIQSIPHDRLLTESDGPFIEIKQRMIQPSDVVEVHDYLSKVFDCEREESIKKIDENFLFLINQALR